MKNDLMLVESELSIAVNKMQIMAESLSFVATCIATSEALQFTIDSFVETDNTIGDYFDGKEGN